MRDAGAVGTRESVRREHSEDVCNVNISRHEQGARKIADMLDTEHDRRFGPVIGPEGRSAAMFRT